MTVSAKTPAHLTYLTLRGISREAYQTAEITPRTYRNRLGIEFPIVIRDGANTGRLIEATRWMAIDGDRKNRFLWLKDKHADMMLYAPSVGYLSDAIKAHDGVLHWCEGEIDTWSLWSANLPNATTYYGADSELSRTFELLQQAGLKTVRIYADCDTAGMKKAAKAAFAARQVGIEAVHVHAFSAPLDSGYDVNDFWKAHKFDPEPFVAALIALPTYSDDELELYYDHMPHNREDGIDDFEWQGIRQEWFDMVQQAAGKPDARHKRRCPLPHHEDRDPSFYFANRVNGFPWPMCNCGVQDRKDAWAVVAEAVGVSTYQEFYREKLAARKTQAHKTPVAPTDDNAAPIIDTPIIATRSTALKVLKARLQSVTVKPEDEPIPMPVKSFYSVGGFARIQKRGRMVLIVGPSGAGKTSFLTSLFIEPFLRAGEQIAVSNQEWTSIENAERELQSVGGITMQELYLHELWLSDKQRGYPDHLNRGVKASAGLLEQSIKKLDVLTQYAGEAHYLEGMSTSSAKGFIAGLELLHRQYPQMRLAFLDYIQLLKAASGDDQSLYEIIQTIKTSDIGRQMVIFIVSQVTKVDSRATKGKKADTFILQTDAAVNVREDPFNLAVTLNPRYYTDGEMKPYGTVFIGKNSIGKGRVAIDLKLDLEHLRWLDEVYDHPDEDEDEDDEIHI